MIIPSKTIKEIKLLETPNAVTKGNLTHILIGNRLDKPVDLKKGALLGHLIANNPTDNLCYVLDEENSTYEEVEDEIEEKIYIPDISKQELIKSEDIISHLKLQTNHCKKLKKNNCNKQFCTSLICLPQIRTNLDYRQKRKCM